MRGTHLYFSEEHLDHLIGVLASYAIAIPLDLKEILERGKASCNAQRILEEAKWERRARLVQSKRDADARKAITIDINDLDLTLE